MIKSINLNGVTVEYSLTRKKMKSITIRIRPDGQVDVSAGRYATLNQIENFLRLKADFVLGAKEKYRKLSEFAKKPKIFCDGEILKYLGGDLKLKFVAGTVSKCEIVKDELIVNLKDINDFEKRKNAVEKWQRQESLRVVKQVSENIYPMFLPFKIGFPEIKVRKMKSRWGSCAPKSGVVTFNTVLISTPIECIEYVAMHEFCHFLHPDHSKRFYAQLSDFMPNWQDRKALLEKYICII